MKNRNLLIMFLFIFLFLGCDKNSVSSKKSDIEINWLSKNITTYNYSGGVLSGFTWYIEFEVISGSGEITLNIAVTQGDGNTESFSRNVEDNLTYTVKIEVSNGGQINCSQGSVISKIEVSSASSDQPKTLSITCDGSTGSRTHTIGDVSVYNYLEVY